MNNSKFIKGHKMAMNVIKIIFLFIMCIILFRLFLSIKDIMSKVIFLPFLLCGCCLFWKLICELIGNIKLVNLCKMMYIFIFLMYWFGFIGFGIYSSIINKEYKMILFIIPFIMAGIFVGYKSFVNKK